MNMSKKWRNALISILIFGITSTGSYETFGASKVTPTKKSKSTPVPTKAPMKVYVGAFEAELNKYCNEKGATAFSLSGPLVCTNEKWILADKNSSISAAAFASVISRWNRMPETDINLKINKGPKVGVWADKIPVGIKAGARFWGTNDLNPPSLPIFISDSHIFIEQQLAKAGIIQDEKSKLQNASTHGAQAAFHIDPNGVAYFDFLFEREDVRHDVGFFQVGPHEYTHFAVYLISKGNWIKNGNLPWLNEGMASYIGSALGPMCGMPHNEMEDWMRNLQFTHEKLTTFSAENAAALSSDQLNDIFPTGAFASEALVALAGIDSYVNLYTDLANGKSYDEAFLSNFGTSSLALTKMLSNYVESVKANKPWTLKELQDKYSAIKVI